MSARELTEWMLLFELKADEDRQRQIDDGELVVHDRSPHVVDGEWVQDEEE